MQLFKIVGTWFGGLFLMALGGLWLGMAYYLSGFGPLGTMPTVLGLTALGGLTFVGGLITFVRGLASTARAAPLPERSTGWRDDGKPTESDSGFDPDAAINRYLQNRASGETAPESGFGAPAAVRPTFGRKQL